MLRRSTTTLSPLDGSRLADLVPLGELEALERLATRVHISSGSDVVDEAAVGRECMVVVDGSFGVHRGDHRIAELRAGDFIGEVALLTQRPRNATVTALEDSSLFVFNPREFGSLLRECPTIAAHVRAVADERALVA